MIIVEFFGYLAETIWRAIWRSRWFMWFHTEWVCASYGVQMAFIFEIVALIGLFAWGWS